MRTISFRISCILASLILSEMPLNAETAAVINEVKVQLPVVNDINDQEVLQNFIYHNSSELSPRTVGSLIKLISKNNSDFRLLAQNLLPDDVQADIMNKISEKDLIKGLLGSTISMDSDAKIPSMKSPFPSQKPSLTPSGIGPLCCLSSGIASS